MGEAKRRKQTGAPSPARKNNKKPLLIAGALVVVAAVAAALYFLTTPPAPTSDELPVAAANTSARRVATIDREAVPACVDAPASAGGDTQQIGRAHV